MLYFKGKTNPDYGRIHIAYSRLTDCSFSQLFGNRNFIIPA
jgi:hypothetical protein